MPGETKIEVCLVCSSSFVAEGIKSIIANSQFDVSSVNIISKNRGIDRISQREPQLIIFVLHQAAEVETWRQLTEMWKYAKIVAFVSPDVMTSIPLTFFKRANAIIDQDVDQQSVIEICQLVMNGTMLHSSHAFDRLFGDDLSVTACLDSCGEMPDQIVPDSGAASKQIERKFSLSPRELRVLECLVTGSSNKVIARQFNLAESTVKIHVRSILRKLQTRNRTQAALWALENGISSVIQ